MKKERWRSIPGYEGHYEASNEGQVRSIERKVVSHSDNRVRTFKGRILRPEMRHGYQVVNLSKDGTSMKFYVHELVLITFRRERVLGEECCHINGVRDDNRLVNLRWGSHSSNVRDSVRHGTHRHPNDGTATHCHRGHPFDEANTIIRHNGRSCRECRRMNERARYHAKKANKGRI